MGNCKGDVHVHNVGCILYYVSS